MNMYSCPEIISSLHISPNTHVRLRNSATTTTTTAQPRYSVQASQSTTPLLALPSELHLLILSHLNYPSALALRHTHPYFYHSINTNSNIRLKVTWLCELAENAEIYGLDADCPFKHGISIESDRKFCGSKEVGGLLRVWFRKDGGKGWRPSQRGKGISYNACGLVGATAVVVLTIGLGFPIIWSWWKVG